MTEHKGKKEHLFCPYCDAEIMEAASPCCQACRITIFYCHKCQKPLPRENKVCPHCGAEIRGEVSEGR